MSDITFNKARESLGVYRHEDGYLRCRGKLGRGKIPVNKKNPHCCQTHNSLETY